MSTKSHLISFILISPFPFFCLLISFRISTVSRRSVNLPKLGLVWTRSLTLRMFLPSGKLAGARYPAFPAAFCRQCRPCTSSPMLLLSILGFSLDRGMRVETQLDKFMLAQVGGTYPSRGPLVVPLQPCFESRYLITTSSMFKLATATFVLIFRLCSHNHPSPSCRGGPPGW